MVIKTPNGLPSQEWFFDGKTKTIKSMRTKSYSWNIKNSGRTNNMEVYNTNSKKNRSSTHMKIIMKSELCCKATRTRGK